MQLDWTTFAFEIVNFMVLLWILKRFLLRPVREAIARRQAAVAATITQAQTQAAEAQALKTQYEARMQAWDREREAGRTRLNDELARARSQRLAELEDALQIEREKEQVLQERRRQERARTLEDKAADQAADFARRLLSRLSGPALDARIAELVAEDLQALPETQRNDLAAAAQSSREVEIISSHPLPPGAVDALHKALERALGSPPPVVQRIDPALVGGVRIAVGPWALEATLAHELAFFRQGLIA